MSKPKWASSRWLVGVTLGIGVGAGCQAAPDGSGDDAPADPMAAESAWDVLFTQRGEGGSDLYIGSADGTTTHLTPDSEGDNWGVWSPDGSSIAFQARRDGNTEVYVMDADGANPRNISNDPAHDGLPVWSPDGRSIAFFSSRGLEQNDTGLPGHIYVTGADGSRDGLVRVTTTPLESTLGPSSWSPDGRYLYFTRLVDTGSVLKRIDVESGREESLYEGEGFMGGGVLSPGGELLATYVDDGNQARIAVLDLGETEPELEYLSPEGVYHVYPRWSPDGRRIIYTAMAADGRTFDIESIDLEHRVVEGVLRGAESELEASWRPGR